MRITRCAFGCAGAVETNDLEIKLVDSSGHNVWRHVHKESSAASALEELSNRQPRVRVRLGSGERRRHPRSSARSRLPIVAREGGAGTLWVSDFRIEDHRPLTGATASASSALAGFAADQALAGVRLDRRVPMMRSPGSPWTSPSRAGSAGSSSIGGTAHPPAAFVCADRCMVGVGGRYTRRGAPAARAAMSTCRIPEDAFLRLELNEPTAGAALHPQSFEFSVPSRPSGTTSLDHEPRGWYPRWLHREQTLWTPIGTSNGTHCALMNEEGMVEMAPGSFSIEPMVCDRRSALYLGRCHSAAGTARWLPPVPSCDLGNRRLAPASAGPRQRRAGSFRLRYRLENLSDRSLSARLLVLVRPFQVTPPWQSVGKIGGVSLIHDLAWERWRVACERDGRSLCRRARLRASRRRRSTRASSRCVLPQAAASPRIRKRTMHSALPRARLPSIWRFNLAQVTKRIVECPASACLALERRAGIRLGEASFPRRNGPARAGPPMLSALRLRRPRTYS